MKQISDPSECVSKSGQMDEQTDEPNGYGLDEPTWRQPEMGEGYWEAGFVLIMWIWIRQRRAAIDCKASQALCPVFNLINHR